jgi:hypothetical protein
MTYVEVSLNKQNESHIPHTVLVDKVRGISYESFRYVTL